MNAHQLQKCCFLLNNNIRLEKGICAHLFINHTAVYMYILDILYLIGIKQEINKEKKKEPLLTKNEFKRF